MGRNQQYNEIHCVSWFVACNLLGLSSNETAKRTKLRLSFNVKVIKKFAENPSTIEKALADHFKIPDSTLKGKY